MKKIELWKNFNLGTELDISGNFIFNGLKTFHQMKNFYYEDEIFDFLYSISVGIERLFKIIIFLNDTYSTKKIHNHECLLQEIKKNYQINLNKQHHKFIQILNMFYDKSRYDRFNFKTDKQYNQEYKNFIDFLNKYTDNIIINDTNKEITKNNSDIKLFIGETIGIIVNQCYFIIQEEAKKQNIFIYEIRSDSKSYKIFIKKEFNFLNEKIIIMELLLFILQNKSNIKFLKLFNDIKSLHLDDTLMEQYMKALVSNELDDSIYDEVESLQEEHESQRLKDMQSLLQVLELK